MNADILRSAGIDYDFCVRRFAGRAPLVEKALTKFLGDGTFARVRAAFEEGDREQLLSTAHEFKGMCGNIGLTALYDGADAIVRLLRGGTATDGELGAAYQGLADTYAAIHAAVLAAAEVSI